MSGARALKVRTAISSSQRACLEVVQSWNARGEEPCIADVVRATWRGRGHAASYDRVKRLIRRGFLIAHRVGNRTELALSIPGARKLGIA